MARCTPTFLLALTTTALSVCGGSARGQGVLFPWQPESRTIKVRAPAEFPRARIPATAEPAPTIVDNLEARPTSAIGLDDVIQRALGNTDVVRVLSGTGSASSGQTIYDAAIANTRIDQENATFDPTVSVRQDFLRNESPFAIANPLRPGEALLIGNRLDRSPTSVQVNQKNRLGGTASVQVDADRLRRTPSGQLLDPESPSSVGVGVSQPLLQGAGLAVNQVPIVLARLDAESSYFRLKDSVQETVRGVIQAYWRLVATRTSVWAVEQQVDQAELFLKLEDARLRIGSGDQAQLAQARLALANFRANLINAQADQLDAEASLRGILGLPPTASDQLVPMTPPITGEIPLDWDSLLSLAEEQRPDIIELKLVLEADYQLILQSRNQALPQLDALMLYRWNGLEGEMPVGGTVRTDAGEYTDWQFGINFSVPVGLRQSRARLRERELILARDRANLEQGLLEMVHEIASTVRRLRQLHAAYKALEETRLAAADNLTAQATSARQGTVAFINVQQAIVDWGNAVSAEARALTDYNAELANLERVTGTILETHGVRFYEERYASLAPLGLLGHERQYPKALGPTRDSTRYPVSDSAVDKEFQEGQPQLLRSSEEREPPVPQETKAKPEELPEPSPSDPRLPPQRRLPPPE